MYNLIYKIQATYLGGKFMLSKKLKNITPSYTIGISSKVNDMKSSGIDVVNLSIGEPDFTTPQAAKEEAIKSLNENKTKYNLVPGLKELREAIVSKLKKENNLSYDIDEIVVSSGAKHCITNAFMAILDDGDEVLIPKPYWVSYPEMVKLVGGVPVSIDTKKENSFKVTKEEIQKSITPRTKMIIICNPSNPTGVIYNKEELENILQVCLENNIYILADEIYEKICYKDEYVSLASLSEKAKDITITINGFSKSAAMTGLRLGYSASNKIIAKAMSSIQGHLVSHPATVTQWAGYGALVKATDEMNEMVKVYKEKRDLAMSILDDITKLDYIYPEGAFLLVYRYFKVKR